VELTATTLNDIVAPGSTCWGCGPARTDGLGLRYTAHADGVAASWYADPGYAGAPGRLHNGLVAALLEEVAGWAVYRRLTEEGVGLAGLQVLDLAVRFARPVPDGVWLWLRGRVEAVDGGHVRAGAWLSVDGTHMAGASCTLRAGPAGAEGPDAD